MAELTGMSKLAAPVLPKEEELPKELLQQVRGKLKEDYEKVADKVVLDEKDYSRLLVDDDYLRRFVKRKKGDVTSAVAFLLDVLRWRKKLGVAEMSDATFPKEFFDFSGIHVYSEDKDENVVVHVRVKLFHKIPEVIDLLKKFSVYQMLKADEAAARRGGDRGWVLLFDCTGSGLANADIEMANFVSSTLKNYFPSGQKYVLIHNLPWLLNALKNIVFAMLPGTVKKRMKFSNDATIVDFIPKENLPAYMNGCCGIPYPSVPKGAQSTADLIAEGAITFSEEELNRVKKYYEKLYGDINTPQITA